MNTYRIRYTPHNAAGPVKDAKVRAHDEAAALAKFIERRAGKTPVTVRVVSLHG